MLEKFSRSFRFIFLAKNHCFEAQVLPVITEALHLAYTSTGSGEFSTFTSSKVPDHANGVGIWGWGPSVNCCFFFKFPCHSNMQSHFPLDFFLSSLVAFIYFYFYIIILIYYNTYIYFLFLYYNTFSCLISCLRHYVPSLSHFYVFHGV